MDHTFGKLISDPLKLTSHRANLNGVQHQHNISPQDPSPGESVNVYLVSASDPAIARIEPQLHSRRDGSTSGRQRRATDSLPKGTHRMG